MTKKNNFFTMLFLLLVILIPGSIYATKEHAITFDSNGGVYENQEKTYTIKTLELIDEVEIPTREGYKFLGYYTENGISLETYLNNSKTNESITFYAKWRHVELKQDKNPIIIVSAILILIGYFYIVLFSKKDD